MHHLLEYINQDIKKEIKQRRGLNSTLTEYWSKRNPTGKVTFNAQLSNDTRGLTLDLNLQLLPYCVYASNISLGVGLEYISNTPTSWDMVAVCSNLMDLLL